MTVILRRRIFPQIETTFIRAYLANGVHLSYNHIMSVDDNWNIIGHDWAVEALQNHIANGRLRHAYLFTGPYGIGRRTLALRLAQAVNCSKPVALGCPCGECRACRLTESVQHPDLTVVEAEKVGGILKVDQIRELQHTLSLTPFEAQYRVALLLRFEEANPSASNALLKTLEEPNSRVVLMLTAPDPESLLPTIVSRCELIRLRPLSLEKTCAGLKGMFDVGDEEARLFAHIAGGRPGLALQLLRDPNIRERRQSWLEELVRLLPASRVERFAFAELAAKEKEDLENMLSVWSSFWRDVVLAASGSSVQITNLDMKKEIEALAIALGLETAVDMVKQLQGSSYLLTRNVNTRLTLEVLLLDLPHIRIVT
jgi:DNA polymerase-3 subunit delta'